MTKGSTALHADAAETIADTPAIKQLRKTIDESIRYRDVQAGEVAGYSKSLKEAEGHVADYDRDIESFRTAIRALGGEA